MAFCHYLVQPECEQSHQNGDSSNYIKMTYSYHANLCHIQILMVKIINNKAKLILITSYKLGYLLCKLIQFKYSNKYNNSNYKWNKYIIEVDAFNYLIKYKKYLIIRNPYTRIISSFFAISKNKKYRERFSLKIIL